MLPAFPLQWYSRGLTNTEREPDRLRLDSLRLFVVDAEWFVLELNMLPVCQFECNMLADLLGLNKSCVTK